MNRNELDSAKLDFALASNDEKLAAWARRYGEDLMRAIDESESCDLDWDIE